MNDRVIKAYLATFDSNLRIPYLEKKTTVDDLVIVASIYKHNRTKEFYCLAVIIDKGEYLFDDVSLHSRYYKAEDLMTRDVAQETLDAITQQVLFRKRLLSFISNNPKLPSVLSVAFNRTLIIYYAQEGKLKIARLHDNQLVLNLPANEQVYLTDLLGEFGIKVRRVVAEVSYRK